MLKQDIRRYIINGKTFDDFVADNGKELSKTYNAKTIRETWDRVEKYYIDEIEWIKYLKKKAAESVHNLEVMVNALNEEGIVLNGTRAGSMLAKLLAKQRDIVNNKRKENEEQMITRDISDFF